MESRPQGLEALGALRRLQPLKWHGDVSRAISATSGDVEDAAKRLDIAPRTLYAALEDVPTLQAAKDEAEIDSEEDEKKDKKDKKDDE